MATDLRSTGVVVTLTFTVLGESVAEYSLSKSKDKHDETWLQNGWVTITC